MDYYQILGVNRDATDDEIKQAYRKLAAKHHPDRGGDTAKFQEIQQAYDSISTAEKRAAHDRPHPNFGQFNGFPGGFSFSMNGDPFSDIFERMFKQAAGGHRGVQTYRTVVWVTLEQVYSGGEQHLRIQTPSMTQIVKIDIPRGIPDGAQLRYDNLVKDAVLIVEFRTHNHLTFERRGNDLYMNHPVSTLDLIVGTSIEVTTLNDKKLEIQIPPYTQPSAALKVSNSGLPVMNTPNFGDLYINIKPYTPKSVDPSILNVINNSKNKN